MSNTYKGCSCSRCKSGLHTAYGKSKMTCAKRKLRHGAKISLRKGVEPERLVSIPFTD